LSAILEICGDDVTALQQAASPGITGISIRSSKFRFRVIKVLIENFPICLDRDTAVPAISNSDATFLSRATVVICRGEPLIGMLVESRDEDRLFGSFLRAKLVTPHDGRKYEVAWFAEPLQSANNRR